MKALLPDSIYHMVLFCDSIFLVNWFSKPAVAAVEPETDQDRAAVLERECQAAEASFNSAAVALRAYNLEHTDKPFAFRTGDTLRIQTFVNDIARQQLERNFRKSYERRNRAWRARAEFLLQSGRIR